MSDLDVAAIREALSKATPGPWKWHGDVKATEQGEGVLYAGETPVLTGPWTNTGEDCLEVDLADAELIVILRNNADALLDEIERLRGEANFWASR